MIISQVKYSMQNIKAGNSVIWQCDAWH